MAAADMLDAALGESPSIAGVDLSLTGTGIATAEGLFLVETEGHDDDPLGARQRRLHHAVTEITGLVHDVDLVYLEGPLFGMRIQRGTFDRAGLWWLVVQALVAGGATVIEVNASTLKQFATGKGKATKPDIRMEVYKRYDQDIRDDNKADAFVLRAIGLYLAGEPLVALPQSHTAALTVLTQASAT